MTESFRKRFIKAKELNNLRWIDIAKKSGLDKAQISQYKNGVHVPEQDALYKLATALNVNVAWLMGADVSMETTFKPNEPDTYGDAAVKLLNIFSKLNDVGQQEALERISKLTEFKLYTE